MLKFKNLSNNIYSGGKILLLKGKNLTFIKKNKQTLISLFEKNGIIVFRDLDISPKEFKNLSVLCITSSSSLKSSKVYVGAANLSGIENLEDSLSLSDNAILIITPKLLIL